MFATNIRPSHFSWSSQKFERDDCYIFRIKHEVTQFSSRCREGFSRMDESVFGTYSYEGWL